MEEIKMYKTSDLVLDVNQNYDPAKLPLQEWDRYLDILVNGRQFQKEAIQNSIIFLASGLYRNTSHLIEENWKDNKKFEIKSRYTDLTKDNYSCRRNFQQPLTLQLERGKVM